MNIIKRMLFEPRGGMFREFVGVNAFLEPADPSLYQRLLPKPFAMPNRPIVLVFVADYIRVFPWPMTRYQEWAVLLKSTWDGKDGWYCVTMPVTKWVPMKGGRHLGFPKYIADSITLTKQGESWQAQSKHKGSLQLSICFQPGITRQIAPWEKELLSNKSFFLGDAYLLVPPGQGPRAQKVRLDHVVSPQWSPEHGMAQIEVNQSEPWAGLVPKGSSFIGTHNHFTGGINLVAEKLE